MEAEMEEWRQKSGKAKAEREIQNLRKTLRIKGRLKATDTEVEAHLEELRKGITNRTA